MSLVKTVIYNTLYLISPVFSKLFPLTLVKSVQKVRVMTQLRKYGTKIGTIFLKYVNKQ
jgi:hypothetical protein